MKIWLALFAGFGIVLSAAGLASESASASGRRLLYCEKIVSSGAKLFVAVDELSDGLRLTAKKRARKTGKLIWSRNVPVQRIELGEHLGYESLERTPSERNERISVFLIKRSDEPVSGTFFFTLPTEPNDRSWSEQRMDCEYSGV